MAGALHILNFIQTTGSSAHLKDRLFQVYIQAFAHIYIIRNKAEALPCYQLSWATSNLKVWILWARHSEKFLSSSSAAVLLLELAVYFLQSLKLCLGFLLCNKTGRRWRSVSNHFFSCLVQNACSCPPFSVLNNTRVCPHFISMSELAQDLLSISPLAQSKLCTESSCKQEPSTVCSQLTSLLIIYTFSGL